MTARFPSTQLPVLTAYLERNNISIAELTRCCSLGFKSLNRSIRNGRIDHLIAARIETVLHASGYRYPSNLWQRPDGTSSIHHLRLPEPTLYTLGSHHVVRHRVNSPAYRHQVALRHIAYNHLIQRSKNVQPLTPQARNHFSLRFDPFTNEIRQREDVWWSKEHQTILAAMLAAARRQHFLAIIGEVGAGKTLVKRELYHEAPDNIRIIEPLFPDKSRIRPGGIMDAIILELAGKERAVIPNRNERKARHVRDLLEALEKEGQTCVLILDEAHDYTPDAIRSLKRLHEIERGFAKLLGIILIGQLELLPKLDNPSIREVQQRCAQYLMHGLRGQTRDYLDFKLARAGAKLDRICTPDAIAAIERLGTHRIANNQKLGPYPLILNVILTAALNLAARLGIKQITPETIDRAWGQPAAQEER